MFYGSLAPHGEWIYVDRDVYAWRPLHVTAGWRPYLYGRWAWTDHGWYWVSEEPWAWAVYHYGRWYCDDYYGWIWIPGYEWAPAWVEWRIGGSYVGWAPLGPYAVFSISFGVYYTRHWATPYHYWSFVPCHSVTRPHVDRYVYRTSENVRLIGRTRGAGSVRREGGRIASRGPSRSYIEERGQIRVSRTSVVDVDDRRRHGVVRTGGEERIEVFRPRIEERSRDGVRPRPDKVRTSERIIPLDTRRIDVRARALSKDREKTLQRYGTYRRLKGVESVRGEGDVRRSGSERRYETRLKRGARRPGFEAPVERGGKMREPARIDRQKSAGPRYEPSKRSEDRPDRSRKSRRNGGSSDRSSRSRERLR